MEIAGLLALLIAGHIIADFYLQPGHWVAQRNAAHFRAPCLYWHGTLHGLLALVVLLIAGQASLLMLLACALFIWASHIVIDGIKSFANPSLWAFITDQVAHILVIVFVAYLSSDVTTAQLKGYVIKLWNYQTIVVVCGFLVVLRPVSIVVRLFLKPWSDVLYQARNEATVNAADDDMHLPDLASAGQRIGYLERTLILIFILLNQFAAIGFLLAAKSVFRFGDLRQSEDKKLTEYVMLGTLSSFAITIVIGLLVSSIVTQLPVGK